MAQPGSLSKPSLTIVIPALNEADSSTTARAARNWRSSTSAQPKQLITPSTAA